MGNANCSRCCQGADKKCELDLKSSIILQSYNHLRRSINLGSQPSETNSTSPDSQHEIAALKIKNAWQVYRNIKQYQHIKKLCQPNNNYFTSESIRETIKSTPLSTKRKKKGIFTYKSGATYDGEWVGGFRDGQGVMIWPDGCIYEGEFSFGYPFGEGKFTHVDQEVYEGRWRNPYSSGNHPFNSGSKSFLESIVNGKRDGYLWLWYKHEAMKSIPPKQRSSKFSTDHCRKLGNLQLNFKKIEKLLEEPITFIKTEFKENFNEKYKEVRIEGGIRYFGELSEGKRHGKGRNLWENGDMYEGQWGNDTQTGAGKNTWTDGSSYIGYYKENLKEGIGHYIWDDGTQYIGEWKNNQIHGVGKYMWADGRQYLGCWDSGVMNGFGIFTWKDGKKYEGDWEQGKKHGIGYTITNDGKISHDRWEHGKMIKLGNSSTN